MMDIRIGSIAIQWPRGLINGRRSERVTYFRPQATAMTMLFTLWLTKIRANTYIPARKRVPGIVLPGYTDEDDGKRAAAAVVVVVVVAAR